MRELGPVRDGPFADGEHVAFFAEPDLIELAAATFVDDADRIGRDGERRSRRQRRAGSPQ